MLFNFWVAAWLEDQWSLHSLPLLFELCFLNIVLNYLFSNQQNKMFCSVRDKWRARSEAHRYEAHRLAYVDTWNVMESVISNLQGQGRDLTDHLQ